MALPPILIPVKPQNAIWLYSSRVVEVEAGFRLFTQASGQMSVHDNVWGRLALPALSLSTNEMVLMLLGRKAMTIEAFDGLLFASCYFGTTPGCIRFSRRTPLIILVPSKFALYSTKSQCISIASYNSCKLCMARLMATTDISPRPAALPKASIRAATVLIFNILGTRVAPVNRTYVSAAEDPGLLGPQNAPVSGGTVCFATVHT